jgi:tetratricopeptide (TPR) repeat protein
MLSSSLVCPEESLPVAGTSGLSARALLGWMDREQALKFLTEDCLFSVPLTIGVAADIWEFHKAIVESLPGDEPRSPQKLPLSAADLKAARKFRNWHPGAESVIDFVRLNPMDLVVHQLWASTAIADAYSDKVSPDKWLYTALLDPPSESRIKWRRDSDTIIFDLPHSEFFLAGPLQPSLEMRVSEAQGFVTVAFHAGRALLISGYHRTFACAQRALDAENAPRGVLFGVSNQLEAMGSTADDVLSMMEGPRPPRMADFFDNRLFLPVTLRKRRYQMRIHCEVVEVDVEEAQTAPGPSPVAAAPMNTQPGGRRDVQGILADALRHYRAGRIDDAVAHYQRALFLRPDNADAHNNLGLAFAAQGRIDEAVTHYERATVLNPDHAGAHGNLGIILKDQGKFDEAMARYGRALAIRPDYAEIQYYRAEIKTFHRGDADLAELQALADRDGLPENKAPYIHFALAKALEDSGDHAGAFEHLRKGNALKRRQVDYDEKSHVERFQRIAAVFDANLFARFHGSGDPSSVPVFVLGMPRSGSTLIEQILASHPQVHGAGELTDLDAAVSGVLSAGNWPGQYPDCVPALDGVTLRRIGQSYLSRLPALTDGAVRIVDKMPNNFNDIGLIRLVLPNARIIHTTRHPIDTCVSCYSKLFLNGQYFSYDLAELGRYYRGYRELMTHWRSVLPSGAMLEVSYEDVVDDLEGQARRLIDYCGLPWDDHCISFYKTIRLVKTASAAQVRQPLFRTSLQRWRKYEAGLTPLLQELGDIA